MINLGLECAESELFLLLDSFLIYIVFSLPDYVEIINDFFDLFRASCPGESAISFSWLGFQHHHIFLKSALIQYLVNVWLCEVMACFLIFTYVLAQLIGFSAILGEIGVGVMGRLMNRQIFLQRLFRQLS